ncbi:MAG: helix-turn-helix domain-containing protein [Minicystis sp.]
MPLSRFENLDTALKARILSAAQAEFARHGYEEASLARVAAEAGISKATLYYYFVDRDDLYATVVLRLVQTVASAEVLGAFKPERAEDFWPAMEALFRAGLELARRHPEEMRVLKRFQVSLRRTPRPVFDPVLAIITANLRLVVETGRRLGCVRTDVGVEFVVELLRSADEVLDREGSQVLESGDAEAIARHGALALDTFRRLMEPRKGE